MDIHQDSDPCIHMLKNSILLMRNANEAAILVTIGSRLLSQIKPSAEPVLHTERLKTDKPVITWIHNSMADGLA